MCSYTANVKNQAFELGMAKGKIESIKAFMNSTGKTFMEVAKLLSLSEEEISLFAPLVK